MKEDCAKYIEQKKQKQNEIDELAEENKRLFEKNMNLQRELVCVCVCVCTACFPSSPERHV